MYMSLFSIYVVQNGLPTNFTKGIQKITFQNCISLSECAQRNGWDRDNAAGVEDFLNGSNTVFDISGFFGFEDFTFDYFPKEALTSDRPDSMFGFDRHAFPL